MVSEMINVNKEDLYNLIRDELHEIKDISDMEQLELEKLHGKFPKNLKINYMKFNLYLALAHVLT